MSFFTKSIIAVFFLASGTFAVLCMLALMGKSERRISSTFLRRAHKTAGAIFFVLTIVISYFCLRYVVRASGALSPRAIFHMVLALALFIVLVLKIAIVQFYRELMRFVPAMGLIVFSLAFLVFSTSAGYFFLRYARPAVSQVEVPPAMEHIEEPARQVADTRGDGERGAQLFELSCSVCHYTDRVATGGGPPGLKGVLKGAELPASGRPATAGNIEEQIRKPIGNMPAFNSLTDQEIADIIAYLRTL
jgi:mono/diheme cytochrome c family protein